jgi:hypothetical protein
MKLALTGAALALRQQLAHENDRMREALRLIADIAEHSTSAMSMTDIARLARAALVASPRENTNLRHPEKSSDVSRS